MHIAHYARTVSNARIFFSSSQVTHDCPIWSYKIKTFAKYHFVDGNTTQLIVMPITIYYALFTPFTLYPPFLSPVCLLCFSYKGRTTHFRLIIIPNRSAGMGLSVVVTITRSFDLPTFYIPPNSDISTHYNVLSFAKHNIYCWDFSSFS